MQTTIRNTFSDVPQGTPPIYTLQEQAIARSLLPSLRTYWLPLHEFREQWATFGATVYSFSHALSATGHAFFALSHESRAHQHFTQLAQVTTRLALPTYWQRYEATWKQTERDLHESCHHWSRAAFCLDQLLPRLVTVQDCEAVRMHSRAARWQQERLWALLDEARRDIATWCLGEAGAAAGVQGQEGTTR